MEVLSENPSDAPEDGDEAAAKDLPDAEHDAAFAAAVDGVDEGADAAAVAADDGGSSFFIYLSVLYFKSNDQNPTRTVNTPFRPPEGA